MIRKARITDLKGINALGEQLHSGFSKLFHMESEINSNISILLVSVDNNIVNGYLYAQDLGDNIDLLSVFVDNKYRLKHIGSSLLENLINEYPDKTITLEVEENNESAIALYKKFNFKIVNTRKNYYKDGDAYLMKRGI